MCLVNHQSDLHHTNEYTPKKLPNVGSFPRRACNMDDAQRQLLSLPKPGKARRAADIDDELTRKLLASVPTAGKAGVRGAPDVTRPVCGVAPNTVLGRMIASNPLRARKYGLTLARLPIPRGRRHV